MELELVAGEAVQHRSRANAVIVPSEYGLSEFAAGGLLHLVGQGGKEAIGGHLHVTDLRLAFVAHGFNRLKGTLSVPIPLITGATRWRSGLSVGIEVATPPAVLRFVTWSRAEALASLERARAGFGPAERDLLARRTASDLTVRSGAEALNQAAAALFRWAG